MKKYSILLVLLLSAGLVGCEQNITKCPQPEIKEEPAKENIKQNPMNNQELSKEDFSVKINQTVAALDTSYKVFAEESDINEVNSELITSELVGEDRCKYYSHSYEGINIMTSNVGYKENGGDINSYYIVGIKLLSPKYQTRRAIKVESTLDEVEAAYGKGLESEINKNKTRTYILGNESLNFYFNSQLEVETIELHNIMVDEGTKKSESNITESDIQNRTGVKYLNNAVCFEVTLPNEWEGKYIVDEWEKGTSFIHLVDGKPGDTLFTISIFGTPEQWKQQGDYPDEYIGENHGKVYVCTRPSESSYDVDSEEGKKYIKDYVSLSEDIKGILKNIQFLDPINPSPQSISTSGNFEVNTDFLIKKLGKDFEEKDLKDKLAIVKETLSELQSNGYIQNLHFDSDNNIYTFQYKDGTLGVFTVKESGIDGLRVQFNGMALDKK